jgi:hypothetical protein
VLAGTTPPVGLAVAFRPIPVYRRRRVVALLVVVGTIVALLVGVQALLASFGGAPAVTGGSPHSRAAVYVVQPGDTFWEIARRLRPNNDPRPLVARMVAEHGSPVLVVGERLLLPVPA